jgi:hypothetical protein
MGASRMTENDYVDFCNLAHRLREQAERHFEGLSENTLLELAGVVRREHEASKGEMPPEYTFVTAVMNEEISVRQHRPKTRPIPHNDNQRSRPDWEREIPF